MWGNRKMMFWESDENLKKMEIVIGEVKGRKRCGRYGTKTKNEKKNDEFFFVWAAGCEFFFADFLCVLSFTQLTSLLVEKSKF